VIKVAERAHCFSECATAGVTSLARIATLEQIAEVPRERWVDAVITAAMGVEQAHFGGAVEQCDSLFAR
jgi:hypothetical protein